MLNEAYGFFSGIGTDKHVCNVAGALGFVTKSTPLHVEASLSLWISQNSFKGANTIFGSFAQLFTQDLASIKISDTREKLKIVLQAIRQRIHSPYEVELIWFIIGNVRAYYQKKDKHKKNKQRKENQQKEKYKDDHNHDDSSVALETDVRDDSSKASATDDNDDSSETSATNVSDDSSEASASDDNDIDDTASDTSQEYHDMMDIME